MFIVAQFAFAFLSLMVPGAELVSCAHPFELGSTQSESESNSETTDRSSAEVDARLPRSRRAPSLLSRMFVRDIAVPAPADTSLSARRFIYYSRIVFSFAQPSAFRNLPIII